MRLSFNLRIGISHSLSIDCLSICQIVSSTGRARPCRTLGLPRRECADCLELCVPSVACVALVNRKSVTLRKQKGRFALSKRILQAPFCPSSISCLLPNLRTFSARESRPRYATGYEPSTPSASKITDFDDVQGYTLLPSPAIFFTC